MEDDDQKQGQAESSEVKHEVKHIDPFAAAVHFILNHIHRTGDVHARKAAQAHVRAIETAMPSLIPPLPPTELGGVDVKRAQLAADPKPEKIPTLEELLASRKDVNQINYEAPKPAHVPAD